MTRRSSTGRAPVPRWVGVCALLAAAALSEPALERWMVPDGEIGSAALRAALLAFDVGAVAFGAWVLARRPRSRIPWNGLGLAAAGAVAAWFLAFTAVDTLAPELLGGTGIPYFEIRARYRPDSTLVMVPRRARRDRSFELRGDLHVPGDELPDPAVPYRATYNALGFRANGGAPPFRLVVIGDSFVEFGEVDSTTVSEMLRRATGHSTFNLGRGWYGPHHYVALLERYGVPLNPTVALLLFFEGNDAEDALEYESWRAGGAYRQFSRAQGPLLERFATATLDLASFVQWEGARLLGMRRWMADALGHDEPLLVRNTGRVRVGDESIAMKFGYWPTGAAGSVEELLRTPPWEAVRRALVEFRNLAEDADIAPLVVFVPTKATTYAGRITEVPERFRDRPSPSPGEAPLPSRALTRLTDELGLAALDLTSPLREAADRRPLLFHAQDTHWARRGRGIAADAIAAYLRERWPEALRDPDAAAAPTRADARWNR